MKKFIIISLLLLSGCTFNPDSSKGLKIYKAERSPVDSLTTYTASESGGFNAYRIDFLDKTGKFNVGDTIIIVNKP